MPSSSRQPRRRSRRACTLSIRRRHPRGSTDAAPGRRPPPRLPTEPRARRRVAGRQADAPAVSGVGGPRRTRGSSFGSRWPTCRRPACSPLRCRLFPPPMHRSGRQRGNCSSTVAAARHPTCRARCRPGHARQRETRSPALRRLRLMPARARVAPGPFRSAHRETVADRESCRWSRCRLPRRPRSRRALPPSTTGATRPRSRESSRRTAAPRCTSSARHACHDVPGSTATVESHSVDGPSSSRTRCCPWPNGKQVQRDSHTCVSDGAGNNPSPAASVVCQSRCDSTRPGAPETSHNSAGRAPCQRTA